MTLILTSYKILPSICQLQKKNICKFPEENLWMKKDCLFMK